jgi:hypothetical protein
MKRIRRLGAILFTLGALFTASPALAQWDYQAELSKPGVLPERDPDLNSLGYPAFFALLIASIRGICSRFSSSEPK